MKDDEESTKYYYFLWALTTQDGGRRKEASCLLGLFGGVYCLYLFIITIYLKPSGDNKVYINTTDSTSYLNINWLT